MNNFFNSNKGLINSQKNLFPANKSGEMEKFKLITSASVKNNSPKEIIDFLNTIGFPSSIIRKIIKNFNYDKIIKAYTYYNRKNIISKISYNLIILLNCIN